MTQEDKDLLLKDLCGRLPYEVKCEVYDRIGILDEVSSYGAAVNYSNGEDTTCRIEYVKPYLFPLSSMTEEQKEFLRQQNWCIAISTSGTVETTIEGLDWLNKNHFDYRGIIEKGLAIDATGLGIY